VTADECLHDALNLPTSVVITGVDSRGILDQAFAAARLFKPMSDAQLQGLLAKTVCGITPGIRTLQDLFDIRCHVGQGLDGRRARTAATPDAGLIAVKVNADEQFACVRTFKPIQHRVDNNKPPAFCKVCLG